MPDRICPYSATLVKSDFACHQAEQVVRRGGAEIACLSENMHTECCTMHHSIKASALAAMGLEDDLLSLPHSVLVKIQFGGLLGLQSAAGSDATRVDDIASLISTAKTQFSNYDALPFDSINAAIIEYKISRRGRK